MTRRPTNSCGTPCSACSCGSAIRRSRDAMPRGAYRHLVTLQGPGGTVPDGDGGWITTPTDLDPPTWWCAINPASVRDLERLTAGTAVTSASFIVTGDYHPGITTQTQITFEGRLLFVNGTVDPEERHITTIAFCEERPA